MNLRVCRDRQPVSSSRPACSLTLQRLLLVAALAVPAIAQQPRATITGGIDASSGYSWTVTNHDSSPIVAVEFPHFHGDMFTVPEGWKHELTEPEIAGARGLPGVGKAWVENPTDGIASGKSQTFQLRIARIGADRGRGVATVRFADGATLAIDGVAISVPPTWFGKYGMAIGLAGILAFIIWIQARKRSATRTEPTST